MSLQTLSDHPESYPVGLGGVALLGALLGDALTRTWHARHAQPRRVRSVVVPSPRHGVRGG